MNGARVKGWCPSALRPMLSGDGLIVRIRPPLARLMPDQGRGIARAAARYGNGLIDLSQRGNLQLRGVRDAAHAALLADLTALGLIDEDAANVLISPFWQVGDGSVEIVSLLRQPARLSDKFGFAVDAGPLPVLQLTPADIRIERHGAGFLIRPDSFDTGAIAPDATIAAAVANDLATWFQTVRGDAKRLAALWPDSPQSQRQARLPPEFQVGHMTAHAYIPAPGQHAIGQLVGPEFGQIAAELLEILSENPLRVTPWRMLLVEGETDLAGLITDPADPRLRVTACTGAPGCAQAWQATRQLARILAAQVPLGKHLHISGCAKGCAHPRSADVTLCGTAKGFAVIRNGRASDPSSEVYGTSTNLFKAL